MRASSKRALSLRIISSKSFRIRRITYVTITNGKASLTNRDGVSFDFVPLVNLSEEEFKSIKALIHKIHWIGELIKEVTQLLEKLMTFCIDYDRSCR